MENVKKRFAKRISETKLAAKKLLSSEGVPAFTKVGKKKIGKEELGLRIQDKAYELFVKRGGLDGSDMADWFEAERLVKAELGI